MECIGEGVWRAVKGAVLRTGRILTRHPQIGNCEAPDEVSMFTQVNFRCINKVGCSLNERGAPITLVCDNNVRERRSRKRVEEQELLVNERLRC